MQVQFTVNGKAAHIDMPDNTLLVQALREKLLLTGTCRLRHRPVRRVHRHHEWPGCEVVQHAGRASPRRRHHHH